MVVFAQVDFVKSDVILEIYNEIICADRRDHHLLSKTFPLT